MVLYSSNKFGILKPWTNIPWLRRFDLGIWKTPKQIYEKLQYWEKVFEKFQGLPRFPRKIVLYLLTKLGIIKTWTNIQLPSRFNLGFWQTSKQIYRKLQYKQKVFEEFQALPCFPRKIVLYSSTNFGNLKLLTNIPWLRRFDLCFWQAPKRIYGELHIGKKVLELSKVWIAFPEKWFCFCCPNYALSSLKTILNWSEGLI